MEDKIRKQDRKDLFVHIVFLLSWMRFRFQSKLGKGNHYSGYLVTKSMGVWREKHHTDINNMVGSAVTSCCAYDHDIKLDHMYPDS